MRCEHAILILALAILCGDNTLAQDSSSLDTTELPLHDHPLLPHPESSDIRDTGQKLSPAKQYIILAPERVRPDMTYQIHIMIREIASQNLSVRAIITQDGEEYASGIVIFTQPGSKDLLLKVPPGITTGVHILTVEGITGSINTFPTFREHRILDFHSKHVSLFIQTDKPVYHPNSDDYPIYSIHYRIVSVKPDLTAATGAMTIFLRDAKGIMVRRDLQKQLTFGQYLGTFDITYPLNPGTWHIVVEAFGHRYEHPFEMILYYFRRYEVNVTAPLYIMDTEPMYRAYIKGEHMSRKEAYGNASVSLRCIDSDGLFLDGEYTLHFQYLKGTKMFEVPMTVIRDKWGDYLDGLSLHLEAWMHDWELAETQNNTAVTKIYRDTVQVNRLGNDFIGFHPLKPFMVYFAVSRSDGTPYTNDTYRTVEIEVVHQASTSEGIIEEVVIPDDAIIKYKVFPREDDDIIAVRALHENSTSDALVLAYRVWSDVNNYYLAITSSTKQPMTNEYMVFTLRTNFFAYDVHYLVMSKGQILVSSLLTMYSKQKTFSIGVSREMLPSARILAYTVVNDRIIMDSMAFPVHDSLLNTGTLVKNRGKDFSFDTLEMIGRSDIGSFMSLNGHHYEWARRGADTFINLKKVMRELYSYTEGLTGPNHHIWHYNDTRWDEDLYYPAETLGLDGNTTLQGAGLVVISDMRLSFAHGDELNCNRSQGLGQCIDGSCFHLSLRCDGYANCPDGYDEIGCPAIQPPVPRAPQIDTLAPFYTLHVDNVWTFKTEYLKPNLGGQVEMRLDVPELLDTYIFNAFFIHPEKGLTLAKEPVMHNLTRWFFMRCEAPTLLRRGEQVGVRCALFNKWNQDLELIMTLHGGEGYRFINVEEFGIVSSYSPRMTAGDIQIMVYMLAGEERYIYWPIQPIVVMEEITVKVSAWSTIHRDTEEMTMEVRFDGCVNEDYTIYLIDLWNKPSVYTPYLDTAIDPQWYIPGQRDHVYIPGSPTGLISVWGGVAVGGFWEEFFDADAAAGLPHDALEGYTFDFAFNMLTMDYLQQVNRLDQERKDLVLNYLKSILMRHYAYLQEDGGMKMFRRAEKSCLWCTSQAMNYLHDFFVTEWAEEVYIPIEILNRIALWMTRQQNTEGAFIETSDQIYNKHFYPNMTDEDGVEYTWHIPTTAHVTITLAKAVRLTDNAKAEATKAVRLAAEYLADKIDLITDPMQMAITAYALDQAGHTSKDYAFYILKTMRRQDRNVYWSPAYIRPNDIQVIDNKHIIAPRDDFIILGNAVMATSYALLLHLAHGEFQASRPIANWLVDQHMDIHALSSCLDTLLATEALIAFVKRETNHQFYNMKITLSAPSSPGWEEVVYINGSNYPNFQQFWMPEAWGPFMAHSEGTGYAQISVFTEHMVEKPYQVWTAEYITYDWLIENITYSGRNSSIMTMYLCNRWLRDDIESHAGMSTIWMDVPSGFNMDRDEIVRIYRENKAYIKRVRFRDQTLWVFFERVTLDYMCFDFKFRRWYPISNSTVSHFLGLYEYAETALFHFVGYSTYTLFHLHACHVCASFQCPYCPWYNSASMCSISLTTLLVPVLLILYRTLIDW